MKDTLSLLTYTEKRVNPFKFSQKLNMVMSEFTYLIQLKNFMVKVDF